MAHREKREKWVDAEIAARKRGKMAQAEHALEVQSRRVIHEQNEADWMGVGANYRQMEVFTENAVDDLEEHQFQQHEAAQQRAEQMRQHNQRVWRRQNRLANQRRNVQQDLRQRLGREPLMDEFIAEITKLKDDRYSEDD